MTATKAEKLKATHPLAFPALYLMKEGGRVHTTMTSYPADPEI